MLRELAHGDAAFTVFISALAANGLPIEDISSEPCRYFSWDDIAWGGVGIGEHALLRSIVVSPEARQRGVGSTVVGALAEAAAAQGTRDLWLLTTDAAPFFARLGWREVSRDTAPVPIQSSNQFASVCPASATLMVRAL